MRSVLVTSLFFAALAGAGLFHTWTRVEGLRLGYELSELTEAHQTLLRERERLRLEVATLEAPARIERLARRRLGMRAPRPQQVVILPEPRPAPAPQIEHAARPGPGRSSLLAAAVEVSHGH